MPEKLRDQISDMVGSVMAEEVAAATKLERERCAKIADEHARAWHSHYAPGSRTNSEQVEFSSCAVRIANAIRAIGRTVIE